MAPISRGRRDREHARAWQATRAGRRDRRLGERGARTDVPQLAPYLWHPYPQVRYFAKHAIERLTGAPLAIDVGLPRRRGRGPGAALAGGDHGALTASRAEPGSSVTAVTVEKRGR